MILLTYLLTYDGTTA